MKHRWGRTRTGCMWHAVRDDGTAPCKPALQFVEVVDELPPYGTCNRCAPAAGIPKKRGKP